MTPIMQAVVKVLQRNPAADFQTVKAKVASAGDLYPIVYGRAKALLGLVKSKPRKDRPQGEPAAPKRGPGRPRKLRPADAVQAAQERKTRAASNGSPGDGALPQRLANLIAERDALSQKIEAIEEAISA